MKNSSVLPQISTHETIAVGFIILHLNGSLVSIKIKKILNIKILTIIAIIFTGCGGKGEKGDREKPRIPVVNSPKNSGGYTRVPYNSLSYLVAEAPRCLTEDSSKPFPEGDQKIVVDGLLGEWVKVPVLIRKPLVASSSLSYVKGLMTGGNFILSTPFTASESGLSLVVELGGVLQKKGGLTEEVRRLYKITHDGLYDYDDGWHALPESMGVAKAGPEGTELSLRKRLMGDVFSWPMWWLRIYSVDVNGVEQDSTFAKIFKSSLGDSEIVVSTRTCQRWAGNKQGYLLQQVTVGEQHPAAQAFFSRFRQALNIVSSFLNEPPLDSQEVSLLSSHWAALPQRTSLGEESRVSPKWPLLSNSFVFDINSAVAEREGLGLSYSMELILDVWIARRGAHLSDKLRIALKSALLNILIRNHLGEGYWLDHFPLAPSRFLNANLYKSFPADPNYNRKRNEPGDLGQILSLYFNEKQLIAAFDATANQSGLDGTKLFMDKLKSFQKNDTQKERVNRMFAGWIIEGDYDVDFGPLKLDDDDHDGLFDLYEKRLGTDPKNFDSDKDGWSDLAEVLTKSDPLEQTLTPLAIVPDGDFSDWMELIPQRVYKDRGAKGECKKGGDITKYSALIRDDGIMVGAVSSDFTIDVNTRWEVLIDLPAHKKGVSLQTKTNSRINSIYNIDGKLVQRNYRALPYGVGSIEWFVPKDVLNASGLNLFEEDIFVKIRTVNQVNNQSLFCDETQSFSPVLGL